MNKKRAFISNTHARIPFSIIGVLLIIGSSFTTVYIAELETEKSKEISFTLDEAESDKIIRFAEADLARSLNYAACDAFDIVGQSPVRENIDEEFGVDADPNEANLNIALSLTRIRFNEYIIENFQNNSYHIKEYIVNVKETITDWNDIKIQEIYMTLKRDNLLGNTDHPVYPIFSVELILQVTREGEDDPFFQKTSTISTIITNRYLLLESLTNQFQHQLHDNLGLSVFAGITGLSLVRGLLQYSTKKPTNIVSTSWLEIVTSGCILMHQGFVFCSVDPLGTIYVGVNTAQTIAQELGINFNLKEIFESQTENPVTDLEGSLSGTVTDFGGMPDDAREIQGLNIEEAVNKQYQKLINSEFNTIQTFIDDAYKATLETEIIRGAFTDHPPASEVTQWLNERKISIKNNHESSVQSDANTRFDNYIANKYKNTLYVTYEWEPFNVSMLSIKDPTDDGGKYKWYKPITINDFSQNPYYNDNNQNKIYLNEFIYDYDKEGIKVFIIYINSYWRGTAQGLKHTYDPLFNTTTVDPVSASLDMNFYRQHTREIEILRNQIDKCYIISRSYSKNNNIVKPFLHQQFNPGIEIKDPNLADLQSKPIIDEYNESFLSAKIEDYLFDENLENIIESSKVDYNYPVVKSWAPLLESQISIVLNAYKEKMISDIEVDHTLEDGELPEDELKTMHNAIITEFQTQRTVWLNELNTEYKVNNNFKSAGAKVLYQSATTFINNVYQLIDISEEEIDKKINDAINDAFDQIDFDGEINYDSIKNSNDDAQNLKGNMKLPLGKVLTLTNIDNPNDFSKWSEPVSFAVRQNPSYFSKEEFLSYYEIKVEEWKQAGEPDGEEPVLPKLKYRNINVFSPGAAITGLVEDGFGALNQQVLGAIDNGFDALKEITDEALKNKLENTLHEASDKLYAKLSQELFSAIRAEVDNENGFLKLQGKTFTNAQITAKINNVLLSYSNKPEDFIRDMNNSKIAEDLVIEFQSLLGQNPSLALQDAMQSAVLTAYDKATSIAIDHCQSLLKDVWDDLSKELEKSVGDAVADLVGSCIPSGFPILPPFGWWITINVWIIEVEGVIPEFSVTDTYDETNPHPFYGHTAQEYIREIKEIRMDVTGKNIFNYLGNNNRIEFDFMTGTFIIVPPGAPGAGDKTGGFDEVSDTLGQ